LAETKPAATPAARPPVPPAARPAQPARQQPGVEVEPRLLAPRAPHAAPHAGHDDANVHALLMKLAEVKASLRNLDTRNLAGRLAVVVQCLKENL
jgi:hypothetical protein